MRTPPGRSPENANREIRQYSEDMALMLEWFDRVGYSADIAGLEREFVRPLVKVDGWIQTHVR